MLEIVARDEQTQLARMEEAEGNFALAAEIRIEDGWNTAVKLLQTNDERIHQLLSNVVISEDFDLRKDYLTPTSYTVDFTVSDEAGETYQFRGTRFQCRIVNPMNLKDTGAITQTGGGVRFDVMEGKHDGTSWTLPDIQAVDHHIHNSGIGLLLEMNIKNNSLDMRGMLTALFDQMGIHDRQQQIDNFYVDGGAKGDIVMSKPEGWDDEALYPESRKNEIIAKAVEAFAYELTKLGAIGPGIDRLAGDVMTGGSHNGKAIMEYALDGYRRARRELGFEDSATDEMMVSGKTNNGLEARKDSTGWTVAATLRAYCALKGISLEGEEGFSYGTGDAVRRALTEAITTEHLVLRGVAAGRALIKNITQHGFSADDAIGLYHYAKRNIADWAFDQKRKGILGSVLLSTPQGKDWSRALKADVIRYLMIHAPKVLYPAARENIIDKDVVRVIRNGTLIVEPANGGLTPKAVEYLENNQPDTVYFPGGLANRGGVAGSFMENAQTFFGVKFKTEDVERVLYAAQKRDIEVVEQIREIAKEQYGIDVSFVKVYYALALSRGLAERQEFAAKAGYHFGLTDEEFASASPDERT